MTLTSLPYALDPYLVETSRQANDLRHTTAISAVRSDTMSKLLSTFRAIPTPERVAQAIELIAMYDRVAASFAVMVQNTFKDEESLRLLWMSVFSSLPFDRTGRWNLLLKRSLQSVWVVEGPVVKAAMTQFDIDMTLQALADKLDYNLFTQVMLNLQDMSLLRYRVPEAEADVQAITEKWAAAKDSPLNPKAKMLKNASTSEEMAFNRDLSSIKAIKIIAGFQPSTSFRVSPMGSTPALTDSSNISSLGFGADRYVTTSLGMDVFYVILDSVPQVELEPKGAELYTQGIAYPFISKSGGDVLAQVLTARMVAYEWFRACPGRKLILPRMGSVMIITAPEDGSFTYPSPYISGPR